MELVAIAGACAVTAGGLAVAERTAPRYHAWRMARLERRMHKLRAKAKGHLVCAELPGVTPDAAETRQRKAARAVMKANVIEAAIDQAADVEEIQHVCKKGWQTMLAATAAFALLLYPVEALLIAVTVYLGTQVAVTVVGYRAMKEEQANGQVIPFVAH